MSCDSFDENSDEEGSDYARSSQGTGGSFITNEIPDIRTWIKNPTDFFRLRRGSEEIGPEDKPWTPSDTQWTELPVTQSQILVSVYYLPTAERLSVVVVRTKIPQNFQPLIRFICAKAHLRDERTGRRANKKKTRCDLILLPHE